jgi:hypothetical protein
MLSETREYQDRRMHRQFDLLQRTADQNKFEEIHEMNRAGDILYHFCCVPSATSAMDGRRPTTARQTADTSPLSA